jgi:hypothetical protein
MNAFYWIAEERIKEALSSGELDNLPGMGEPLKLEESAARNSDTHLTYTILKNAGFLPLPLLIRKEIEDKTTAAEALSQRCRERLGYLQQMINADPENEARMVNAHNAAVREFRLKYLELLMTINQKIDELQWHCIRESIVNEQRVTYTLELQPINIARKMQAFDAEFYTFTKPLEV